MAVLGLAVAAHADLLAAPAPSDVRGAQDSKVTVVLPLIDGRERAVVWKEGLTIDQAIRAAAPSAGLSWKEAWRFRPNFWSKRNPRSFWARLFAGERATGYTYFPNARGKAPLQPGDRVFVDLAPID